MTYDNKTKEDELRAARAEADSVGADYSHCGDDIPCIKAAISKARDAMVQSMLNKRKEQEEKKRSSVRRMRR